MDAVNTQGTKSIEKNVRKSSALLMLSTMLSRVLGLFREILTADIIGGGALASSWAITALAANIGRRIFGEGAVGTALVPILADTAVKHGDEAARKTFSAIFIWVAGLLSLLAVLTSAAALLVQPCVKVQYVSFALRMMPVVMPYGVCICLVGISTCCCNCFRSFFLPSLTAVMQNVIMLVTLYFFCSRLMGYEKITALSAAVLISGFAELIFLLILLYRQNMYPVFSRETATAFSALKQVGGKAFYGIIGASMLQISALVDQAMTSAIGENAPAAIFYSQRLIDLPVGLFAVAFGTVSLTETSRLAAAGDTDSMMKTLISVFRSLLFVSVPLMIFMYLFSIPLIRLFFYRGAFDDTALEAANLAFVYYAVGIPSFCCLKISVTGFYSVQDMKTPLKISACCIALNVVLNLILMRYLLQGGIALATVICSYLNNACLIYLLNRKYHNIPFSDMGKFIAKLGIISCVSCGTAYFLYGRIAPVLLNAFVKTKHVPYGSLRKIADFFLQAVPLGICCAVCAAVFILLAMLLRIPETDRILSLFRRLFRIKRKKV